MSNYKYNFPEKNFFNSKGSNTKRYLGVKTKVKSLHTPCVKVYKHYQFSYQRLWSDGPKFSVELLELDQRSRYKNGVDSKKRKYLFST